MSKVGEGGTIAKRGSSHRGDEEASRESGTSSSEEAHVDDAEGAEGEWARGSLPEETPPPRRRIYTQALRLAVSIGGSSPPTTRVEVS